MGIVKLNNPDCVLIHIPKTGGTSIRKGFWKGDYQGPRHGYLPDEWLNLFKFAFVRHPLDRFISAYKMFTEGPVGDPAWRMPADAYPLTMEQFFAITVNDSIIFDGRRRSFEERIRHHSIPQTHPFNCLHRADFVGRFERLDKDFAYILSVLGMKGTLPKMHYTTHNHWRELMPPSLIEQCYNYYRKDFGMLGYEP